MPRESVSKSSTTWLADGTLRLKVTQSPQDLDICKEAVIPFGSGLLCAVIDQGHFERLQQTMDRLNLMMFWEERGRDEREVTQPPLDKS